MRGGNVTYEEMDDVLMEIVKDRVDAERQQTTVSHIKEIMKNLKYTAEQAMDLLSIPQSQHSTYAGLVGKRMQ